MSRQKSSPRFRFISAMLLLSILLFLVPAFREGNHTLYLICLLVPCAVILCETLLARLFSLDRLILALSLWFCTVGIAALALSDPEAALVQSLKCGAGLFALLVGAVLIRSITSSLLTSACSAFLGLLILSGRFFASTFTIPLTEVAMALLLISFASLLTRQGPVSAVLIAFAAFILLLLRDENAGAFLWGLTVLLLLFAADGRLAIIVPSLAVMVLLFLIVFSLKPFPAALPDTSPVSLLISFGAVGMDSLPEEIGLMDTFSLFPRLTGHYGLIFSGLTVSLFLPFILRAASVAGSARTRFHAVLAMGSTLLLSFKALAGLLSAFGIISLKNPEIPFLTVSLPDLCAQFFLAGLLCGISGRNDADLAEDAHLAMLAK